MLLQPCAAHPSAHMLFHAWALLLQALQKVVAAQVELMGQKKNLVRYYSPALRCLLLRSTSCMGSSVAGVAEGRSPQSLS